MKDLQTNFTHWMSEATKDKDIAQYLYDTFYPTPFNTVCYHCQQAIEKAMKSFLIYHNKEFDMTHNLEFLRHDIELKIMPLPDFDETMLSYITKFEVNGRYPSSIECSDHSAKIGLSYANQYVTILNKLIDEDIYQKESLTEERESIRFK